MKDEQPHEHVWGYKGLEYEVGRELKKIERLGNRYERNYFDVYFCESCLREKLIPRELGKITLDPAVESSTPRGDYRLKIVEEPDEPTPSGPREAPVRFERV